MQLTRTLFALASTTLLSACGSDNSLGPFDKSEVTINLCPEFMASGMWFAVQNQGEGWTQITPTGGVLTFDATEKVSIAFAYSLFNSSVTQIVNTTAETLDGTTGVPCDIPTDFGAASFSGTVSGLSGEQFVTLSAGPSTTGADATLSSWTLSELPNVPLDLVATRFAAFFTSPADKVIVRRNLAPNSSSLALDFGSAEARDFENAIVAFTNVPAGGAVSLEMSFQTQTGSVHTLGMLTDLQAPFAFNYVSVPASLRVATDFHVLDAFASAADADLGIVHLYKAPSAKTFSFGPPVAAPTVTQIATTPYLRLRAQLAKQAEYPAGISILFWQNDSEDELKLVSIMTTAEYLDAGATTWDVTIPDFGSGSGYDPDWGMSPGSAYFWNVMAFQADPSIVLGAAPVDGATATYSIRASDESGVAAARSAKFSTSASRVPGLRRGRVLGAAARR